MTRRDLIPRMAGRLMLALVILLGLVLAVEDSTQNVLFYVPYATVGLLLVIRRPRNAIGWLLLALAALDVVSSLTIPGTAGPWASGTAPLAERMVAWLTAVAGPLIFSTFFLLAIVFPSGRLPAGRWGRVLRLLIAVNGAVLVSTAVGPTVPVNLADGSTINTANPFALLPPVSWWATYGNAQYLVLITMDAVAAASLLVRMRGARGLERQQLRWVVASLVLVCGTVAVAVFTGEWLPAVLTFPAVPVAIGIAVLRYRLYEIDRLISRTIGWAAITLILGGLFVAVVLGLQAAMAPFTGSNGLAVAGSTLLVAALFQPLRRRVQRLVDQRFDRAQYDAERALAGFAARLRDEVVLDRIRAEMTGTVDQTLEPASVSLWLRR